MRGVIVDLDRSSRSEPRTRPADLVAVAVVVAGCLAFAALVSTGRLQPVAVDAAPAVSAEHASAPVVPLGVALRTLQLPPGLGSVTLSSMPDRLANEAAPATLRAVVMVRGTRGVASVDGPSQIYWTEDGVAYRLIASDRTIDELVRIAEALR